MIIVLVIQSIQNAEQGVCSGLGKAGGKMGCHFPKCGCARLPEAAETRAFVRQAKLGVSGGVQVPVGEGGATHP